MGEITEEKWVKHLERKADGNYIIKFPFVKSKSGQTFDEHVANNTSGAHLAKNISLEDSDNNFTSNNVEMALDELFTNVSNGKELIATAVTDMGESASGSDTFTQLANSIRNIETGDYSIGDVVDFGDVEIAVKELWNFSINVGNAYSTGVDSLGNIYVGEGEGYLTKIDSNGNHIWSNNIHNSPINALAIDYQDNIYISGNTDNIIRKITPDGNQIWAFTKFSTGSIRKIVTDNFGNTYAFNDTTNIIIKKINSSGNEVWSKTILNSDIEGLNSMAVDNIGNIYIGGYNLVDYPSYDAVLRKLNASGNELWTKIIETDYNAGVKKIVVDGQNNVHCVSNKKIFKITPNSDVAYIFYHFSEINHLQIDGLNNIYISGYEQEISKISLSGDWIWSYPVGNNLSKLEVDNLGNIYHYNISDKYLRKISEYGFKILV